MIASKAKWRTSLMVLLTAIPLTAVPVIAYTYTWTGNTNNYWDDENWTRTGCGSPCTEWPDDPSDSAVFTTSVNVDDITETVDHLTISNAEVRIGKNSTGYCQEAWGLTVDSVTVIASSGNSAKLRGGACGSVVTD